MAKGADAFAYTFPHPRVEGAPLDFSFSGLKTAVLNILNRAKQTGEPIDKPALGASYMRAVADCLVGNTVRALEMTGEKKLVIAGGVSANSVLRARLKETCQRRGVALYMPPLNLCSDNAAMVAAQGFYELKSGNVADLSLNAVATLPIDYRR